MERVLEMIGVKNPDPWSKFAKDAARMLTATKYARRLAQEEIDDCLTFLILAGVAMGVVLLFMMISGGQKQGHQECKLFAQAMPKWAFSIVNLICTYTLLFMFKDHWVQDKEAVTWSNVFTYWNKKWEEGKFLQALRYDIWEYGQVSQQHMAMLCVVGFVVVITCWYRTWKTLDVNHGQTSGKLWVCSQAATLYICWAFYMHYDIFRAAISGLNLLTFSVSFLVFVVFVLCLLQI